MKNNKGFTMVELLLYMGLLAIFLTMLTRLFTATLDVQLGSEATGMVEEDSRYIYSRFAYDISRANAVVVPVALGISSNTLTIMIGSVANTYSLSGTNLMLANNLGAGALNSY